MTTTSGRASRLGAIGLVAVAAVVGLVVGRHLVPKADDTGASPSAVDVGFARDMLAHHQQAVQMSRIVLDRVDDPADPEVLLLARQIIETQVREIGVMSGFLQVWERSQLASGPAMAWMHHDDTGTTMPAMPGMDHSADPGPEMGMATQEQLAELSNLGGAALTERFIELMTRHHLGALVMADAAASSASTPAVRHLAAGIVVEQQKEIQFMSTITSR